MKSEQLGKRSRSIHQQLTAFFTFWLRESEAFE